DGDDFGAVGLDCQSEARARAAAVQRDGAGATDAVLTTEMGAGQMQVVADEISQRQPHRYRPLVDAAVDPHLDVLLSRHASVLPPAPERLRARAPPSRQRDADDRMTMRARRRLGRPR